MTSTVKVSMAYRVFILLLLVVWPAHAIFGQSRVNVTLPEHNPFKEMLPVDFCEVTHHPQRYEGKLIRIRAIFSKTFEGSGLLPYDSKDCWDWMRPDCSDDKACRELHRKLRPLPGKELEVIRVPVLLVGRLRYRPFLTYRDVQLGFHRYEFVVTSFVETLKPLEVQDEGSPRP